MPSPSLAEVNPEAYSASLREAPAGAGSCGHCGTGILHHVVVKLADGSTGFIGTDCANRVGSERVRESVSSRMTEQDLEKRDQKRAEQAALHLRQIEENTQRMAKRYEELKDIIDVLEAQSTDFHSSLASQLRFDSLSDRQATFAVKAVLGRETKKNSDQWWSLYERCTN